MNNNTLNIDDEFHLILRFLNASFGYVTGFCKNTKGQGLISDNGDNYNHEINVLEGEWGIACKKVIKTKRQKYIDPFDEYNTKNDSGTDGVFQLGSALMLREKEYLKEWSRLCQIRIQDKRKADITEELNQAKYFEISDNSKIDTNTPYIYLTKDLNPEEYEREYCGFLGRIKNVTDLKFKPNRGILFKSFGYLGSAIVETCMFFSDICKSLAFLLATPFLFVCCLIWVCSKMIYGFVLDKKDLNQSL